jgi:uncharacterized protein with NRDE domain
VCTLAVALGTDRRWPLVIAANRDERLGRPAESWALREVPGGQRAAAPRDVEAGGTWIGVNAAGLVAAITNFFTPEEGFPDRRRRSRGELVTAALAARSLDEARAAISATEAARYNPFHLLVADGSGAGLLWRYDGRQAAIERLGPGLHVVTERDPFGRGPRGEWIHARWPLDLSPAHLRTMLAGHGEPAWDYPCIHLGDLYGTRSSTILRLGPSLLLSELLVADGPPCQAPFEDRSRLLVELGGMR